MVASADRRPPASTDVATPSYLPLVLVNLATLFSAIGNGIAIVVLPWLVLERTGRATDAAIVAAQQPFHYSCRACSQGPSSTNSDVVERR
ncbi:hypothetical protein GCM10020255_094450 [Rhodococcus baikonurensis]